MQCLHSDTFLSERLRASNTTVVSAFLCTACEVPRRILANAVTLSVILYKTPFWLVRLSRVANAILQQSLTQLNFKPTKPTQPPTRFQSFSIWFQYTAHMWHQSTLKFARVHPIGTCQPIKRVWGTWRHNNERCSMQQTKYAPISVLRYAVHQK